MVRSSDLSLAQPRGAPRLLRRRISTKPSPADAGLIMHVTELDLSPAALVCLRAADITDTDQLSQRSADDLLRERFGASELYEIVCQLNMRGTSLPCSSRSVVYMPKDRQREMFRLRIVEGLTLAQVGERVGIKSERVRQILYRHFGLRGSPPTVQARRWAETERRRAARREQAA